MSVSLLPHLSAFFDGLCLVFLLIGGFLIRSGNRSAHQKAMVAATASAALFLVFYLIHHLFEPLFAFRGPDWVRPYYFTFLICHVLLAVAMVPLIVQALKRALTGNFDGHKAIVRWLFPGWLYTSVSGLIVYTLLYQLYPPTD